MNCLVGVMRSNAVTCTKQIADRTRTEEVPTMSQPDSTPGNGRNGGVKTLAIRLEPDVHAQLSLIAHLRDSTITDELKEAVTTHIANVKAAPELAARADSVIEDIEREATARRAAIATLFGDDQQPGSPSATGSRNRSSRKPAGGDTT